MKVKIKKQVLKLLVDCAHANWDGEGALPVKPCIAEGALNLVDSLPTLPMEPDVSADAFGKIDFDWEVNQGDFMLCISVQKRNKLAFASSYSDPTNRERYSYGNVDFNGYLLPFEIDEEFSKLIVKNTERR